MAAQDDTLSVVVPNYNHACYLPDALDALLGQTRIPDEIIVIDDCSSDNSLEVIEAYAKLFPGLVVIRNEVNRGVIANLNKGLEVARGEFIAFAAADDKTYPRLFESGIELLKRYPQAALFSARSDVLSEDGKLIGMLQTPLPIRTAGYIDSQATGRHLMDDDAWFVGTTTVWRRSLLAGEGGFVKELGAFTDGFASRKLALMHGACFSPEVLAGWRQLEQGYAWEATAIEKTRLLTDTVRRAMLDAGSLFPLGYPDLWRARQIFGAHRFALVQARRRARERGFLALASAAGKEIGLSAWYFLMLRARDTSAVLRRRLGYLQPKVSSNSEQ